MNTIHVNRLIKHGAAAMLVALAAGFCLIWAMIGGASLSPLPVMIEFEMPGSVEGWRIVHIGMLMNGMMAIALGCAVRWLAWGGSGAAWVSWGTVIAVWGNFCFYIFGMFAPNHGVTAGTNQMGEGNLAGMLAFFPAFLGAVTLAIALIAILRGTIRD